MENNYFNKEDLTECIKSKKEMWYELNNKTVKCITVTSDNLQIFAVKEIESEKLYILDYKLE